jgi:hypothetical protein
MQILPGTSAAWWVAGGQAALQAVTRSDGGFPPISQSANVTMDPLHNPTCGSPPRSGEHLVETAWSHLDIPVVKPLQAMKKSTPSPVSSTVSTQELGPITGTSDFENFKTRDRSRISTASLASAYHGLV